MRVIIKLIDSENISSYDKLVDISPEGTLFHKSWWLNSFKTIYGDSYEVKFYGAFQNDDLIGALPIPLFHKIGLKLIYPPKFTPYLGSFFKSEKDKKRITEFSRKKKINEEFAKIIRREGSCLRYPFNYKLLDLQPFKWAGFQIDVHYTYVLSIEKNLNQILQNMDKKRRNDIKKALSQNFIIKSGNIYDFIKLVNETFKRQQQPLLSERFIKNIYRLCKFKNCGEIFTIYNENDKPQSSLFLAFDRKRSYYLAGGFTKKAVRGVMSLLLFESIKYSKEKLKLKEFDFEGSNVRTIEYFFREFGGEIVPVYDIYENSFKRWIIYSIHNSLKKIFKKDLH